jgi:hypothetical protein
LFPGLLSAFTVSRTLLLVVVVYGNDDDDVDVDARLSLCNII